MKRCLSLAGGLLASGLLLVAGTARAHIDMLGALKSRGGDEKQIPCDGSRGADVYTFEPGAFITLGVTEVVKHDSYFRIAFDNDGQDGFKEPGSIAPINKDRVTDPLLGFGEPREDNPACMKDTADNCGQSDFCNVVSTTGATVLWDNIDPHLSGESAGTYTWTIQLPSIECENCVLQVLQIMEDPAGGFHGPFDGDQDIYHRCIDIRLKKGAGTNGPGNAAGGTVKVGTPGTKYPDPNKNCLAGMTTTGDAGAPLEDAGSAVDAGRDAGTVTTPGGAGSGAAQDAAVSHDSGHEPSGDDDDEGTGGDTVKDAGHDSGAKKDAGTKKDAGASESDDDGQDDDDDDEEASGGSSDDGCAAAGAGADSPAWLLFIFGALTMRRRRASTRRSCS